MTEEAGDRGPVIATPVAEMLARIESKLDTTQARIETKLDTKADKADLVAIWSGMDHHAKEIATLKEENAARRVAEEARHTHDTDETRKRDRRRDTIIGVLMVTLTIGLVLGSLGVHV